MNPILHTAAETTAHLLTAQAGTDEGESPIESVPVDGTPPEELPVADQNAVLMIAFPVVLLVVGAILHVVRRPAPGAEVPDAGHKGGLILMGVGGALTFAMLAYLMLAQ